MSNFGNTVVVLTDEDGKDVRFEHIDTLEYLNEIYMAFIPAKLDNEDEAELVILKVAEEDGEEILVSLTQQKELDAVFDLFIERIEKS